MPHLAARYGVRSIAIFGSVARDEQTSTSDVDLLVDVDPSIGLRFVDLSEELETLLEMPTDVISTRSVPAHRRAEVEADLLHVA